MCMEKVDKEHNQNAVIVEVNISVAYWGCEVMKAQVQQLRVKEKVSWGEALKMAGQEK